MLSNLDLQQIIFGRLTWGRFPSRSDPGRDFHRRRPRRRRAARRGDVFRQMGLSLARMVHEHRSQADRHHVRHPGDRHAAARLRRCDHDADAESYRVRSERGLSPGASFRSDLHRPRHDHDLLLRDAVGHAADELCHAAADRRPRRRLPVPEQLQLLDDRGRGDDHHGSPCSSASSAARDGWRIRRCPGRPTVRGSASIIRYGGYR